ncbi:hypothetical protein KM043_000082 [Ampulex compressa]|nr:hypothetical protein KM043_000082 [Ampulex compressa]
MDPSGHTDTATLAHKFLTLRDVGELIQRFDGHAEKTTAEAVRENAVRSAAKSAILSDTAGIKFPSGSAGTPTRETGVRVGEPNAPPTCEQRELHPGALDRLQQSWHLVTVSANVEALLWSTREPT